MTPQEILFIVGVSFVGLGVVLAGIAAALFFRWNIPDIIADLSGKKRSAAIEQLENESVSRRRRRKGKTIDALQTTGDLTSSGSLVEGEGEGSKPAQPDNPDSTTVLEEDGSATEVLGDDSGSTTVLDEDDGATTVLDEDGVATTVLGEDGEAAAPEGAEETAETPADEQAAADDAAADAEKSAEAAATEHADGADEATAEGSAAQADTSAALASAEATDGEENLDPSQTLRFVDPDATAVMPRLEAEGAGDAGDSGETEASGQQAEARPEGFVLLRKIVLTESAEYVRVE